MPREETSGGKWQGPFRAFAVELFERPDTRSTPDLLAPRRGWMAVLALIAALCALSFWLNAR